MAHGQNGVSGIIALYPVVGETKVEPARAPILNRNMKVTVALLMDQKMLRIKDVMKIHAPVSHMILQLFDYVSNAFKKAKFNTLHFN